MTRFTPNISMSGGRVNLELLGKITKVYLTRKVDSTIAISQ